MTLTEAARFARKAAFWGGILVVLVIFVRISINVGSVVFRQFFPQSTPPPTVGFGKLTPFDFSQNNVNDSKGVSFSLQTIEEELPNLGDQGKVFKAVQKPPSIIFGEEARRKAQQLGFSPKPEVITERLYAFSDPNFSGRKLLLDIFSGNFKITNDFALYPELLEGAGKLSKEDAIRIAKGFLTQNNLLQKDFADDKISVTLLKIEGGKLVKAKSVSENQIIRVGFARGDLEKLPIIVPDFEKPNVWIEVTPLPNPAKQILQVSYFYYPADLESSATYPLKSTKAAYEEIIGGNGITIGEKLPKMEIRRIYLAYLETAAPMNFFAPVYVFSGDNFAILVPAVSSEWLGP